MQTQIMQAIASDSKFRKTFSESPNQGGLLEFIQQAMMHLKQKESEAFSLLMEEMVEARTVNPESLTDEYIGEWLDRFKVSVRPNSIPTMPENISKMMKAETFTALYQAIELPVKTDHKKRGEHGIRPPRMNHRISTETVCEKPFTVKFTGIVNNTPVGTVTVSRADYDSCWGMQTVTDAEGNELHVSSNLERCLQLVKMIGNQDLFRYYTAEYHGYRNRTKRADGTSYTGGALRNLAGKMTPPTAK